MASLKEIQAAAKLLCGRVLRTPLVYSPTFSKMTACDVYLKLENLQMGGSFKVRGATYKIQTHLKEVQGKGIVAASVGNHAQGVAIAARASGIPARIFMPTWVSLSKQEATKGYGAEVVLDGGDLVESIDIARENAIKTDRMFMHPYDDPDLIAGHGTIGLEILEDLQDTDMIVVPVGGGGLIAGIAVAVKALSPDIKVIGVQATACPSAFEALRVGKPVRIKEKKSIADAIMVPEVGKDDFYILRDLVDGILLVDEGQIASAMLLLLERKRILAEGAGATPLAALLDSTGKIPKGRKVVLVISGGNADLVILDRILRQGLTLHGRVMRFSAYMEDAPGNLARLLGLLASLGGDVLQVHHSRSEGCSPIFAARIDVELETRGFDHIFRITGALRNAGYEIELE